MRRSNAARVGLVRSPRGGVDHPRRELADEAGLLGERNEFARQDEPALRMLPAQQRFGGNHLAGSQFDLRLQVQAQLAVARGLTQFTQQRQRFLAAGIEPGLVDLAAAALPLGHIHRQLRAADQLAGVASVHRMQRDADAGAQVDGLVVDLQRLFEGALDAMRRLGGCRRIGVRQQQRELVAAQTSRRVGVARAELLQPLGDVAQHAVAEVMTQHVVDQLEAVEVEHQDGTRLVRGTQPLLQVLAELLAVGQARQRIPERQAMHLLLAVLDALAHGLERLREVADLVVGGARHCRAVVAVAEAPRRRRQGPDRLADPLGGQHAAQREDGHAEHGQSEQRQLQPAVGRDGFVERPHQGHAEFLATLVEQADVQRTHVFVGQRQCRTGARREALAAPRWRWLRRRARRRPCPRGDRNRAAASPPAAPTGAATPAAARCRARTPSAPSRRAQPHPPAPRPPGRRGRPPGRAGRARRWPCRPPAGAAAASTNGCARSVVAATRRACAST